MVTAIAGMHYITGRPMQIAVSSGKILSLEYVDALYTADLPFVGPGLVDLQINGYFGIDLNSTTLTADEVHKVTRVLWSEGVTSYYATIFTDSEEAISRRMRIIAKACEEDERTAQSIPGIHLEGPFISPEEGAVGAHNKGFVTAPDWDLFQRWQESANGRIRKCL